MLASNFAKTARYVIAVELWTGRRPRRRATSTAATRARCSSATAPRRSAGSWLPASTMSTTVPYGYTWEPLFRGPPAGDVDRDAELEDSLMPPPEKVQAIHLRFFRPCTFPLLRELGYGTRVRSTTASRRRARVATPMSVSMSVYDNEGGKIATTDPFERPRPRRDIKLYNRRRAGARPGPPRRRSAAHACSTSSAQVGRRRRRRHPGWRDDGHVSLRRLHRVPPAAEGGGDRRRVSDGATERPAPQSSTRTTVCQAPKVIVTEPVDTLLLADEPVDARSTTATRSGWTTGSSAPAASGSCARRSRSRRSRSGWLAPPRGSSGPACSRSYRGGRRRRHVPRLVPERDGRADLADPQRCERRNRLRSHAPACVLPEHLGRRRTQARERPARAGVLRGRSRAGARRWPRTHEAWSHEHLGRGR